MRCGKLVGVGAGVAVVVAGVVAVYIVVVLPLRRRAPGGAEYPDVGVYFQRLGSRAACSAPVAVA